MKYYIKQHVFTFGDQFDVYDQDSNVVYTCQGEVFTFGKKLHVYDVSGDEVLYIEQELFNFTPTYVLYKLGNPIARVKKNFTLFTHDYRVEGMNIQVEGEVFAHEFSVFQDDYPVATISKEWFTFGDAYQIDIDAENELDILGICLCIDASIEQNN